MTNFCAFCKKREEIEKNRASLQKIYRELQGMGLTPLYSSDIKIGEDMRTKSHCKYCGEKAYHDDVLLCIIPLLKKAIWLAESEKLTSEQRKVLINLLEPYKKSQEVLIKAIK